MTDLEKAKAYMDEFCRNDRELDDPTITSTYLIHDGAIYITHIDDDSCWEVRMTVAQACIGFDFDCEDGLPYTRKCH